MCIKVGSNDCPYNASCLFRFYRSILHLIYIDVLKCTSIIRSFAFVNHFVEKYAPYACAMLSY